MRSLGAVGFFIWEALVGGLPSLEVEELRGLAGTQCEWGLLGDTVLAGISEVPRDGAAAVIVFLFMWYPSWPCEHGRR